MMNAMEAMKALKDAPSFALVARPSSMKNTGVHGGGIMYVAPKPLEMLAGVVIPQQRPEGFIFWPNDYRYSSATISAERLLVEWEVVPTAEAVAERLPVEAA